MRWPADFPNKHDEQEGWVKPKMITPSPSPTAAERVPPKEQQISPPHT